jgi:hypothetical protein
VSVRAQSAPRFWGRVGGWLPAAVLLGVCTVSGFAQDGAATVVTMNGQASVLRDNSNSPWALHLGDSVKPQQAIVTGADGYALLRVSDGSTFEVFPNSRVVFRKTPGNWQDLLEVFLGRVKVHIQKLAGGQPNYNKVRTPTAVISVRGTIFDVAVEDEDATTLVSVEEGEVGVRHLLLPQKEDKILDAGEWIRVYRNQPLISKSVDRSGVVRGALRAAADAMYEVLYRTAHSGAGVPGSGSGSGSGTGTGDKGPNGNGNGGAPPPPPPPPPPAH